MKLINPFVILRILSNILRIESISFLCCLPVVIIYKENPDPFIFSALISVVSAEILFLISGKTTLDRISTREGFLSVTLAWIFLTAFGALPYMLSGSINSFAGAFFESSSGFTTTGSTVISDVESLPYSILFWRSFTHWIGGFGIIMLVIIILPSLGMTAGQLFNLESSLKSKIHPRTQGVGLRLLYVYLGLTITEIILLNLGEMNIFDSICHTFGSVATGGFSTKNTSLSGYSAYTQYIIMIFMFLSGISFVVFYYLVKLRFRKVRQDEELWFYILTVLFFGTLASSILITSTEKPIEPAIREGFFQVISIITTTGYITTDYLFWPSAGLAIVFVLLFAGGSTGSTTGSIKMVRHLLVIKNIKNTMTKLIHPNVITQIKINNKPLSDNANISILSFITLYLFLFLVGTILLVILKIDLITAGSAVATSLGNIGPGLGSVGPMFHYGNLPFLVKLILSFLMIIGRLEIITVFVLFSKSFWRI
jgi:trk system potassium uptake protein TrkH